MDRGPLIREVASHAWQGPGFPKVIAENDCQLAILKYQVIIRKCLPNGIIGPPTSLMIQVKTPRPNRFNA